jgi:outer membrane protein TolC
MLMLVILCAADARETLTLEGAEARATAHQPEIQIALSRVIEAERQAEAPMMKWLPRAYAGFELAGATVNNGTAALLPVAGIDVPRISSAPAVRDGAWKAYPSTLASIDIRQTLFDFGKYEFQASADDASREAEKSRATLTALDARFAVDEAFFSVLAAKAILRAADDARTRAKAYRDLAAAGVQNGLRPPIELTRTDAELARIAAVRVRAEGEIDKARLLLAAAIGAPMTPVDASDDTISFFAPPPLAEALSQAQRHAPELRLAEWSLTAAERRRRATLAAYLPDLALEGILFGFAGGAPPSSGPLANGGGWVPNVPNYALAVTLSVPLFDFDTIAKTRIASARVATANRKRELATQRIATQVQSAYVDRQVAEAALPELAHAVTAAEANWKQAEARFSGGIGTSVELADAEAIREDADIQLALGKFALARAVFAERRALAED